MEFDFVSTGMAEFAKLLYIVVVDEEEKPEKGIGSFRYTRHVLQSTLQLMGCKPRHAFKVYSCFLFVCSIHFLCVRMLLIFSCCVNLLYSVRRYFHVGHRF